MEDIELTVRKTYDTSFTQEDEREQTADILQDNATVNEMESEAQKLRRYLQWYFYNAFKWKRGKCSFHPVYCCVFLLQIVKVSLLTVQMFDFGYERANFSYVVNRGHVTLRHLLLKGWDASWETLPYPPAHGKFAVYTINDWESSINFAVERYHDTEKESIGYYKRLPGDNMTLHTKYFDFLGFEDSKFDDGMLHVYEKTMPLDKGWSTSHDTYNVTEEFLYHNISDPFKRLLEFSLHFTFHSLRSHVQQNLPTCLRIEGWVKFYDLDNNGQVDIDLITDTVRIRCVKMGLNLTDWSQEDSSKAIGGTLLTFCLISLVTTCLNMAFGIFVFMKTKTFMKRYYQDSFKCGNSEERDLPFSEYLRFYKIWDYLTVSSDILTMYSTVWIVYVRQESDWMLETLDSHVVWLGVACILAWLCLLRFFRIHNKFQLLFGTIYRALGNVLAYLVCVFVLFIGFWITGFLVLGPYHVKFQTPWSAAETLFSILNGDEIFATLAIEESKKSGGPWVFWFSRFYIGFYAVIFTIVVINLLVALFMSSYETIREQYEAETKASNENLKNLKTLKAFMEGGESGETEIHCGNICNCGVVNFKHISS